MSVPRLLIISLAPPGADSVAEIWVRDICSMYPSDKLALVVLSEGNTAINLSTNFPSMSLRIPTQLPVFRQSPVKRFLYPLKVSKLINDAAKEVVRFGQANQVQKILAFVHRSTGIMVAEAVATTLKIPTIPIVFDAPEYKHQSLQHQPFSLNFDRLIDKFYSVLNMSDKVGVMSKNMKEYYGSRTSIRPVIIRHGVALKNNDRSINNKKTIDTSEYIIGFAGSIYANKEFKSLISALNSMQWQHQGKPILLKVLSNCFPLSLDMPANIQLLGWHTVENSIKILAQSNILYLPYKFDKRFALAAKLSFPTKLTTYVAAQAPILYHGPEESSVSEFFSIYNVGLCCFDEDAGGIAYKLRQLLDDETVRNNARQQLKLAYEKEFSHAVFQARIAQLLNVSQDELSHK
jgi:glycosyltransferase involved in cell wall biosynthesis